MSVQELTQNKRHPNFKGGKIISNGYYAIFVGKHHHLADVRGYAYEHRLNAEKKIGRRLLPTEHVHHEDRNKLNNAENNLKVFASQAEHFLHHRKEGSKRRLPNERNPLIKCACGCGDKLRKFDSTNRPRKYIHGHNVQKHGKKH